MKYYLHDSNAFNDEKVTMLFLKYGYEGLGLFYTALEKLAAQEKPINTEVLKAQLKVGKHLDKIFKYCETLGILCSNNGETFSKQLMNFAGKYQIKKEKNKEKVSQWREKQADTKNVTGYVPVRNHDKVKESKVKDNILLSPDADASDTKVYFDWTTKNAVTLLAAKNKTEFLQIIQKVKYSLTSSILVINKRLAIHEGRDYEATGREKKDAKSLAYLITKKHNMLNAQVNYYYDLIISASQDDNWTNKLTASNVLNFFNVIITKHDPDVR